MPRRSIVVLLPLTIAFVAHASLLGQTPPTPTQDQQKPVFRSGVNLVQVDVVALDQANRPAADLSKDDFEIFEDGVPKDIVSFARVDLPVPPPRPPAAMDVATNAGADEGRLIFLVLDDANSLAARTDAIKQAAHRVVERLMPQDQVGLLWVSLKKAGAREFTTDHASILRAIDAFAAEQARIERRVGPNSQLDLPEPRSSAQPPPVDPYDPYDSSNPPPLGGAESAISYESRAIAGLNLKALFDADRPYAVVRNVSSYLSAVAGRRKMVVYIGQGAESSGGTMAGKDPRGDDFSLAALPVERAIAAALDANVTFYSIAPEGPQPPYFMRLSRETGGFSSFRSDVTAAADRVLDAARVYYLLGYYAEPASARERERRIEVRTSRPDVRVLARRFYRPEPAPERLGARDEASLTVRGLVPTTELELRAFAAPFRNAGRKDQAIALAVEVSALEFMARQTGSARGFSEQAELVVVAVEPGEKVRATERVKAKMTLEDRGVGALSGRYLICARVNVAPGQYQLRIGVRSEAADRSGSVYADVTVPDFAKDLLSLSGLVIGQENTPARPSMAVARAGAIASLVPFTPVLAREFTPDEEAWAYVKVYRRKGAVGAVTLTSTITSVESGEAVWTSAEDRAPAAFRPADETEYRVALPLGALPAGGYRLRVEATCAEDQSAVRRELDFRVVAPIVAAPPVPGPAPGPPRPAGAPPSRPPVAPGDVEGLLDRASAYLGQYLEDLSSVVSEESYEQAVGGSPVSGFRAYRAMRRLRSDFLLVRLPGQAGWTPFRDVFEVDGRPVRDRDDRLRKLFLEMPPDALITARTILDEGARYNIGRTYRNINQPVLPLVFLLAENLPRFTFTPGGDDVVEGVRALRLDYEETSRPTLIRQAGTDRDMPSIGAFWIDPVTGRILKTQFETTDGIFRMLSAVVYRPDEALGLWVPGEMREAYTSAAERIYGKATYANFRRFQVKTDTAIRIPKRP